MIYDKLENVHRYKELFPELINYLKINSLDLINLGKHNISETLFALVMEYKTNSNDIDILENHKKYIDFQIILSGNEKVSLANSYDLVHKQYDKGEDYELVKTAPYFIEFNTGYFMVFYPNEYHRPGMTIDQEENVKKVVFKIKV